MPAVSPGGLGPVSGPASAMALAAGLFAALASTAAKFSLGADSVPELVTRGMGEWLHILLRVGCGGMAFLFNALMWTFFAKALRYSSSARASVTTVASNFLSTAFLGKLLFGEVHAMLWWIGVTITLCGLLLLHTVKETKDQNDAYKKEE
ncbi:transmembrane protein 42a [Hemiscyllium ocellatum]|uniref:transmembrane protein 42a n=1 Tax=Hemiscyllium ocellatum TaxID=170820 RepID=UPI0029660883|nr:transmembrane protein 42a [Hemiscyllium ocellatum]